MKICITGGVVMACAAASAHASGGVPARIAAVEGRVAAVEEQLGAVDGLDQRVTTVEQVIALLGGPKGVTRESVSNSPTVARFHDLRGTGVCDRMERTFISGDDTAFSIREIFTNSMDGMQATTPGCVSNVRVYQVIDGELRMVGRQNLDMNGNVVTDVSFTPGMLIYRPTMIPGESYAVMSRLTIDYAAGFSVESADVYMARYHGVTDQDVALAGDYQNCIAFENGQGDASYKHIAFACDGQGTVAIQESGEVPTGGGVSKYNRIWIRQ